MNPMLRSPARNRLLSALVVVIGTAGCGGDDGGPTDPFEPPGSELIVYRDEQSTIRTIKPDGSAGAILADTIPSVENVAWSFDGQTLFFTSNASDDEYRGVFSVRRDGTDLGHLFPGRGAYDIDCSPVRNQIAFSAAEQQGQGWISYIWVWTTTEPEGLARRLTRGAAPVFAPDGGQIAFVQDGDLKVVSVSGGGERTLCGDALSLFHSIAWSPTGDRILVAREVEVSWTGWEVSVVVVATAEEHRLTMNGRPDAFPSWSADGSIIYWWHNDENGRWDLWKANALGQNARLVADDVCDWEYPIHCCAPGRDAMVIGRQQSIEILTHETGKWLRLVSFTDRYTVLDWTRVRE